MYACFQRLSCVVVPVLALVAGCSSSNLTTTTSTGDASGDSATIAADGSASDASGDSGTIAADGSATDSGTSTSTGSDAAATDASTSDGSSTGDATASSDATTGDGGCGTCIPSTLTWGMTGGLVASSDTSSLSTCRTFMGSRSSRSGAPPVTCSNEVPACGGSGITLERVLAALSPDDVVGALAARTTYGRIIPDAGVFTITYGSGQLSIAMDCAGAPGCTPPTANVQALRALLESLTKQQIAIEPCKSTFPAGF